MAGKRIAPEPDFERTFRARLVPDLCIPGKGRKAPARELGIGIVL